MTMHLERGLSTTSTKKRKTKITKAQQEEFERGWRERNKWLKGLRLPKETFEQYMEWLHGKGTKATSKERYIPENKETSSTTSAGKTNTPNVGNVGSPKNNSIGKVKESVSEDAIISSKLRPWKSAPPTAQPAPTYTGSKMIGIAVLHKSCLQPIFSQEEAEDVAKMRR
jgi:hypothetical protein